MRTKEQIMADATVRFAELNKTLVTADLPPFPIETAYANLADDLNGEDAVVTKWFNETMRKTDEMIASVQDGVGFHEKLYQAQQQLMCIQNICEIHTKLVKLLLIAAEPTTTLH